MDLRVTTELNDTYLRMTATGTYKKKDLMELIELIKAEADRTGRKKVLVNIHEVEGTPKMMDRYDIGVHCAHVWGPWIKVAAVYRSELINKFGEDVAVNRGARLRVEPTEEEALEWLEK